MGYAVMLLLDPETDRFVRDCWAKLAEANITPYMESSGYPPHVTLAGLTELESPETLLASLKAFAIWMPPVPLDFHGMGVFANAERVVFLAATMTEALRTVHAACHADVLETPPDSPSYYVPDRWAPHCTLAFGVADGDLGRAVDLLAGLGCGQARKAKANRIALVETPSARLLGEFAFTGGN